jgi:hypothetical protein
LYLSSSEYCSSQSISSCSSCNVEHCFIFMHRKMGRNQRWSYSTPAMVW